MWGPATAGPHTTAFSNISEGILLNFQQWKGFRSTHLARSTPSFSMISHDPALVRQAHHFRMSITRTLRYPCLLKGGPSEH